MIELDLLNVGVLVATSSTALFTGWAVWQRWRYTPRPLWVAPRIEGTSVGRSGRDGAVASIGWVLENRGDATAHDVRVLISRGEGFEEYESVALVNPGESARAGTEVPVTDAGRYLPKEDRYENPRIFTWTPMRIRITWRQHPNLKRVKKMTWHAPRPEDIM